MVVLKEFPAAYREPLECFSNNGYTRVPSLPMTRLNIAYASFDEYMSKVAQQERRAKTCGENSATPTTAEPIELEVVQRCDAVHR